MESNITKEEISDVKPSLLVMIASPGLQFKRMRNHNKIWGVFFLLSLLQAFVNGLSTYVAQTSPEMLELQKKFGDDMQKSIGLVVGKAIGTGFLGAVIGTLVIAAVYKIFMIFFGNDTLYKKLLMIITYASIILIIGELINALLALIFGGGLTGYTNLSPLFEEGTVAYGIANVVDIFYLWYLILIWIGLQVTAGLTKIKAAVPIVVLFLIKVASISLLAIVFASFMQNMNG